MLRDAVKDYLDHDPHFEWRGQSVTRIENLSDIVFALALGMLVAASSPPQTMGELNGFLLSIIPVTAAFAILLSIWNDHFVFFRRYGLADGRIVLINSCLLFAVLFVAYPLRFAFDSLFVFVLMTMGNPDWAVAREIDYEASGMIMAYFTVGFAVLQGLLAMMYAHALSKREALALSDMEIRLTRLSRTASVIVAGVSLAVGAIAYFTDLNGFAGVFMFSIWPLTWLAAKRLKV